MMKTAEEFYKEILASKELQKEFAAIGKGKLEELGAFLKKHACGVSAESFADFLKKAEGELGDAAAEAVAGGKWRLW